MQQRTALSFEDLIPYDPAPRQGFSEPARERLPMPEAGAMNAAQREAADALIAGPRKAVYGPFLALLRSPALPSPLQAFPQ